MNSLNSWEFSAKSVVPGERESGEHCLVVLGRRRGRQRGPEGWEQHTVGGRIRIRVPEWKFSSFHADSLQCAPPPRRCTNHVECTFFNLSFCLLFPLFLFLFQTSPRHLEKMRPRAHHRLHLRTRGSCISLSLSLSSSHIPRRIDVDIFFSPHLYLSPRLSVSGALCRC